MSRKLNIVPKQDGRISEIGLVRLFYVVAAATLRRNFVKGNCNMGRRFRVDLIDRNVRRYEIVMGRKGLLAGRSMAVAIAMAAALTGCAGMDAEDPDTDGGNPEVYVVLEETREAEIELDENALSEIEPDTADLKPFYLRLDKNAYLSAEDVFIALRAMLPEEQYEKYRTESYGGLYYDDRGKLVLCVTAGYEDLLALPGDEEQPYLVQPVTYSYFQLRQVTELVYELMDGDTLAGIRSCSLSQMENKVKLGVLEESVVDEVVALLPANVEADILDFELLDADDVCRLL